MHLVTPTRTQEESISLATRTRFYALRVRTRTMSYFPPEKYQSNNIMSDHAHKLYIFTTLHTDSGPVCVKNDHKMASIPSSEDFIILQGVIRAHICKEVWTPRSGEILAVRKEAGTLTIDMQLV